MRTTGPAQGTPHDFTPGTGVIAEMSGRPLRFASSRYRPDDTYAEVADDRIRRAREALGLTGESHESTLELITEISAPWGDLPVGTPPRRGCWVSVDGMPFEPSVAWTDGEPAVRLSFESPGDGTIASRMRDGLRTTRLLAGHPGVSIDRFLEIAPLFTPDDPQGYFVIAHAVAWRPGGPPAYKVFLNPAVGGREHSAARAAEAFKRLGLERPWSALADHLGGEFTPAHEPVCVALDLVGDEALRAQLYVAHSGVSAAEIDAKAAVARDHVPGLFTRALEGINGPHTAPAWGRKPAVTTFTLDPRHDLPSAATYVPMIPVHDHDEAARDRVAAFLRAEQPDVAGPYAALLDALADEPLSRSVTQNFVSYRGGDSRRFSVYLAPGLYRPAG
ncbi:tryptophan dimethylallyltransferase family protein [Streptomyces sp. NPDC000594]|uniref:tryptophan dimethylallyltransferase family protein n=1 Tax=Streptomyces sp. NPDC000594 TaxID=3154261 RepID=UPI00333337CC